MSWSTRVDVLEKVARIAAVFVAGLWVYFNSLRGRTFVPRLQLDLSGNFLQQGTLRYLLVKMHVKNVGSSIAQIVEDGSCLKVTPLRQDLDSSPEGLSREEAKILDILKRYTVIEGVQQETSINAIEPGTAINEEKLILLSGEKHEQFELELRVVALRGKLIRRFIPDEWLTNRSWSVVAIPDSEESEGRAKIEQL
jgi:hypothetical protein